MILRTTAAVLALVVLFGATKPGNAASSAGVSSLASKSDSILAVGAKNAKTDSGRSSFTAAKVAHDSALLRIQSGATRDSATVGANDSGLARKATDSTATRARSLPLRTLTLRQQVMFAGGFMAFVAIMMTSMQNFNP